MCFNQFNFFTTGTTVRKYHNIEQCGKWKINASIQRFFVTTAIKVNLWCWSSTSSSWVMWNQWRGLVCHKADGLAGWHSNTNQVMKLNSSSQQRNLKYEFHHLPKHVLVTIKWKQKWTPNILIESRSVRVLGVSESQTINCTFAESARWEQWSTGQQRLQLDFWIEMQMCLFSKCKCLLI